MTPKQERERFALVRTESRPLAPPPDRGRLYFDHQIAEQFLGGLPGIARKTRWVRAHLPSQTRIKMGRDSAWYEADILAWLESRRGDQRKSA